MKESVQIAWNPANMITVVLMVMLFFAVVSFGARLYQQRQQAADGA